jgi:hypothetical protein
MHAIVDCHGAGQDAWLVISDRLLSLAARAAGLTSGLPSGRGRCRRGVNGWPWLPAPNKNRLPGQLGGFFANRQSAWLPSARLRGSSL